jgi:hypothetical protein
VSTSKAAAKSESEKASNIKHATSTHHP